MASSVTVKTKKISYPKKVEIRVGILEPGKAHGGDLTVGDLAEIHEFGGGDVPARAPIRSTFDNARGEDRKLAAALFQRAAKSDDGTAAFQQAANLFGVKAVAAVKNNLANLDPIEASTAKRKEAKGYPPPHTPLIESGILKNAFNFDTKVTP